jgi:hypothetical protein
MFTSLYLKDKVVSQKIQGKTAEQGDKDQLSAKAVLGVTVVQI